MTREVSLTTFRTTTSVQSMDGEHEVEDRDLEALSDASSDAGDGGDRDASVRDRLLGDEVRPSELPPDSQRGKKNVRVRAWTVRLLALACACSLSIGSHYASYILGPIKTSLSRELGTNNTEFSLLISAFSLNGTWTPLVGGLLVSRLGTTLTSILATGIILLGQAILLIGDLTGNVHLMVFGLFIFGLAVSPLALVQETIIVRFFNKHGLGISLAFGLVAGKGASFVAARTSYPLSIAYGPHAPFIVATALATFSFLINLVYVSASTWLVRGAGIELEASEMTIEARASRVMTEVERMSEAEAAKTVAEKKRVRFKDISRMGDVFWAYIGLNVLCGTIWSPFPHLAPNILEKRYDLDELDASTKASYLLVGSVVLYPICGYITDNVKRISLHFLLLLSSSLTLVCYIWLMLPPGWTITPLPGLFSFALGHGFAPLLLVLLVPQIVSLKYVSTALGAHKSMEQVGSTIFQTLAGLALDRKKVQIASSNADLNATQRLLNLFGVLNIFQFFAIILMWWFDRNQRAMAAAANARRYSVQAMSHDDNALSPEPHKRYSTDPGPTITTVDDDTLSLCAEEDLQNQNRFNRDAHGSWSQRTRPLLPSEVARARTSVDRYLLSPSALHSRPPPQQSHFGLSRTKRERRRGELFTVLSGIMILSTWVLFLATAWLKLRGKGDRQGEN